MTRSIAFLLLMLPLLACPSDDDDDAFNSCEPGVDCSEPPSGDDDDDDDTPDELVFGDPCMLLDPTEGNLHNWFEGEADGYQLGWAVVGIDDLDGDGYGEIAFSAPQWDGESNAGKVYIFFSADLGGGSGLDLDEATLTLEGTENQGKFGLSLTALADIDRDDLPELMVGAPGSNKAFLFLGSQLIERDDLEDEDAHAVVTTDTATDELGTNNPQIGSSATSLTNTVGPAAVVIGATFWPGPDFGNTNWGAVAVFEGEELADGGDFDLLDAGTFMRGGLHQAQIGLTVVGIGDIDDDGQGDLAIGSDDLTNTTDVASSEDGVVWFFSGSRLTNAGELYASDYDAAILGVPGAGAKHGTAISPLGDYDGDGVDDFAVGEPRLAGISANDGAVRVWSGADFTGSTYVSEEATVSIEGAGSEGFGTSLNGAGDLNGDGLNDLIISAPDRNLAGGLQTAGLAYIARSTDLERFDGPGSSNELDHQICGSTIGERIGGVTSNWAQPSRAVAIVPDVNGDGLDDLLIGAPTWGDGVGLSMGRVYLVLSRFERLEPAGGDDDSAE